MLCLSLVTSTMCLSGCGNSKKEKEEQIPKLSEEKTVQHEAQIAQKEEQIVQQEEQCKVQTDRERRSKILIAIDPGHQGPSVDMSAQEPNAPGSDVYKMMATGGTVGSFTGLPEYQLNLDISLKLKQQLEELGYQVLLTREDNETAISNAQRASMANDAGADVSIRIHANGSGDPSASGVLALIGSESNPYVGELYEESYRMAESVLNNYCQETGMENLGIQCNDTMTGINWSKIPVIILEMGFMTNQQDDEQMADLIYQERMVQGIVKGLDSFFGFNIR